MTESADRQTIDTGTDQLLCHVEDGVGVMTLNRPEARNALSDVLTPALRAVLPEMVVRRDVGCIVLTGAGQAFCAGGDVKMFGAWSQEEHTPDEKVQLLRRRQRTLTGMIFELEKPVIAALPGPAAGAGLSIALACDLRVAAERAFVTTGFGKIGLPGDYGGSWFLTKLVGTAKARELYYTSERIGARECERLGIFNRVFPDERFEADALAFARRIAAGPPIALRYMKENLNRATTQDLFTCLDMEADRLVRASASRDFQEAVRAFREKREPVFTGN